MDFDFLAHSPKINQAISAFIEKAGNTKKFIGLHAHYGSADGELSFENLDHGILGIQVHVDNLIDRMGCLPTFIVEHAHELGLESDIADEIDQTCSVEDLELNADQQRTLENLLAKEIEAQCKELEQLVLPLLNRKSAREN